MAFWEERVQDLQWIYEQLNESKVRKLASILEGTKSAYWPAFRSMFVNVVGALAEAQDILGNNPNAQLYCGNECLFHVHSVSETIKETYR